MKKSLSVFIALAMVLSLFAGVGARSAKADATFTVTPSGNFTGGLDGVGTTAVNAVGTVTSIIDSTDAYVNVTTAGVGVFSGAAANVTVSRLLPLTATSTDADWASLGIQYITFSGGTLPVVGDVVTVAATGTPGVGTVMLVGAMDGAGLTTDQVSVTTPYGGTIVGALTVMRQTTVGFTTLRSIDQDWLTVGAARPVTFTGVVVPVAVGDVLTVSMNQLQAAVPAYAFLTVGGTVTAGNVASVTWQDTTGVSHTASYAAVSGDTLATATTGLKNAINAVAGGNVTATNPFTYVITLTQIVVGSAGNGKTLTASTTATTIGTSLIVHTLGGLTSPASVEEGKTIQLVAVDPTGAIVAATWTSNPATTATITSTGLVMAMADSGVSVVTATYGTYSGSFAVIAIAPQTITKLAVGLVPASLKIAGQQQFCAIGASTAYAALDYTTQAAWTDTLPVGIVSNVAPAQGSLAYSTPETGSVSAYVASLGATVTVTINAASAVTMTTVPVAVKRVIVLTVGSDIVTVDSHATTVDAAPEIVASRTFVPIRFIAETFGSTVAWIPATKSITITLGTTIIGLQIGNATAVVKGKIIALDAAPYIKNSRSMVPLRVITESFGGDVAWDAINHIITIIYLLP